MRSFAALRKVTHLAFGAGAEVPTEHTVYHFACTMCAMPELQELHIHNGPEWYVPNGPVFMLLSAAWAHAPKLRALTVHLPQATPQIFGSNARTQLKQLQSLDVHFKANKNTAQLVTDILALTALTALSLRCAKCNADPFGASLLQQITALRHLRELKLQAIDLASCADHMNQLVAQLPHMTRLSLPECYVADHTLGLNAKKANNGFGGIKHLDVSHCVTMATRDPTLDPPVKLDLKQLVSKLAKTNVLVLHGIGLPMKTTNVHTLLASLESTNVRRFKFGPEIPPIYAGHEDARTQSKNFNEKWEGVRVVQFVPAAAKSSVGLQSV